MRSWGEDRGADRRAVAKASTGRARLFRSLFRRPPRPPAEVWSFRLFSASCRPCSRAVPTSADGTVRWRSTKKCTNGRRTVTSVGYDRRRVVSDTVVVIPVHCRGITNRKVRGLCHAAKPSRRPQDTPSPCGDVYLDESSGSCPHNPPGDAVVLVAVDIGIPPVARRKHSVPERWVRRYLW